MNPERDYEKDLQGRYVSKIHACLCSMVVLLATLGNTETSFGLGWSNIELEFSITMSCPVLLLIYK
jgi:hypothetical protein